MATPHVLQLIEDEFLDPAKSEKSMTKGLSIEKKIEFLESLTGKVSNRRSRRLLNDRLLMELVPRLNADEIRGLFAPPPWGDDVPPSTFSMTNAAEWEKFRSIDMDKQDKIIDSLNSSSSKRKGHVDVDKEAALNAWRRIGCSTRDALRRSFLVELIEGYEECVRSFIQASEDGNDVLILRVQDPFHRLLLHGVCEFYNLASVTEPEAVGCEAVKKTSIKKKKKAAVELPNISLSYFLRMSREGKLKAKQYTEAPHEATIYSLPIFFSQNTIASLRSLVYIENRMGKQPVQYFVVDAFTDSAFKGNPAAVCILEEERDDKWLQSVASEFNLSETSFLIRLSNSDSDCTNPRFSLRWFTPVAEVKLCGHATLAAPHALFTNGFVKSNVIEFETLSGILTAKKVSDNGAADDNFLIELNFPPLDTVECKSNEIESVAKALNTASIIDIKRTSPEDDLFVVLPSGEAVMELKPEIDEIRKCPGSGIIVSAVAPPESGFDFYSRYFCPKFGIDEDPVTGSAHCVIAPYWSKKLGKSDFVAYQASPRSGILDIQLDGQRVLLRGKAVTVMKGTLLV